MGINDAWEVCSKRFGKVFDSPLDFSATRSSSPETKLPQDDGCEDTVEGLTRTVQAEINSLKVMTQRDDMPCMVHLDQPISAVWTLRYSIDFAQASESSIPGAPTIVRWLVAQPCRPSGPDVTVSRSPRPSLVAICAWYRNKSSSNTSRGSYNAVGTDGTIIKNRPPHDAATIRTMMTELAHHDHVGICHALYEQQNILFAVGDHFEVCLAQILVASTYLTEDQVDGIFGQVRK